MSYDINLKVELGFLHMEAGAIKKKYLEDLSEKIHNFRIFPHFKNPCRFVTKSTRLFDEFGTDLGELRHV